MNIHVLDHGGSSNDSGQTDKNTQAMSVKIHVLDHGGSSNDSDQMTKTNITLMSANVDEGSMLTKLLML